jgi:DNA-binding IscR family transcriptional regulator
MLCLIKHVRLIAYIVKNKRRPLTIIDIANVIGISEVNAEQWVNNLKEAGKLKERQYKEKKYYSCPLE